MRLKTHASLKSINYLFYNMNFPLSNNPRGTVPLITTILSSALLAACGGGGSAGNNGVQTVVFPFSSVPIVTVAPPSLSNYSTEELVAYNRFNSARSLCGFGYLAANSNLQTAALNHLEYLVQNNVFSHYETQGSPGYTGLTPATRMTAAGYSVDATNNEVLANQTSSTSLGFGTTLSRRLLGAPYHLMGLMQGNRDIGVSVKTGGPIGSGADLTYTGAGNAVWLLADMASSPTRWLQAQNASTVLTYPCDGVTDTVYEITTETPSPVPSRDLAAQPIGQPIYVQAPYGAQLTITSASITGPAGSVALLPTMTAANDPNHELLGNEALIIPSNALSTDTTYSVTVNGSNGGAIFSKNFTFMTGSSN